MAKKPAGARKVAILGTAPSTRRQAPFDDKSFQIYCTGGDSVRQTPRWDRWYEIHDPAVLLDKSDADFAHWHTHHVSWLANQGAKAFVLKNSEHLPNATAMPTREILGRFTGEFISSGPCWILAHVLYEELYEKKRARLDHLEIGLYGIDMADSSERKDQWDGMMHFILLAEAFGATVLVPEGCTLIRTKLPYPMNMETELAVHMRQRLKTLAGMKAHFEAQRDGAADTVKQIDGQISEAERVMRIFCQ